MVDVTVQLDTSPLTQLIIPVETANGTATAGSDYTALSSASVTFAAGATGAGLSKTVTVTIANDGMDEADETFTVSLGTLPSGVTAGTPTSVMVTITDDDVPEVTFSSATTTVAEGAGTVEVTVRLDSSPLAQLVIPVRTANGTAIASAGAVTGDYTALSRDVTFAAGTSILSQTVAITITDDSIDEADETFTVSFGTLPTGGVVTAGTTNSVTVTITDDDVPEVTFTDTTAMVAEGVGTVDVTVQLDSSPLAQLVIPVRTMNNTAVAGSDYTALNRNVTFTAGATGGGLRQTVTITILEDNLDEADETFTVSFGTLPAGRVAAGADDEVTVTITDNDVPEVMFSAAAATVAEDAGTVDVTVRLDTSPLTQLVIPVETANDTAMAGSDYTALNRNVTFAAGTGTLTQTVSITIANDGIDETDETFTVSFGTLPTGGVVTAGTPDRVTVTITDTDVPEVTFTDTTVAVTEGTTTVSVTVQLDTGPVEDLVIPVETADVVGGATAGSDYTALSRNVTFGAGATGVELRQTVSITILDDNLDEDSETFRVSFGTLPAGRVAAGTDDEVTVTITDDDVPEVTFSATDRDGG